MKDQTAFSTRFARHKDELEWLFMELYHNREGLEVLEREMAEAYNARSAELKALDKARSADPEWYKRGNMFGMTMYTDLFAGNLKELAKKLPYLKEQKLTYLHLMPLLQMPHPHNDGGYAVEDFDTVDPTLGTNKDLENLTRELRKAGISLCLDFVMNHTASTHRWAMAAKAGDPWFQAYYHLYEDRTIPDQYEQTVPQVFPNTAPGNFTWCEEMHKWVLTTFHDYQWDLNYANPAVFVDMTKSILHLANLGVEVFRIDAVTLYLEAAGHHLPQSAAGTHHRADAPHGAGMRLPGGHPQGRGGHGSQGAGGLFRYPGKAGMPHALQRVHHGQPVGCPCQPGHPAAESAAGCPPRPAGQLLVRELSALPR